MKLSPNNRSHFPSCSHFTTSLHRLLCVNQYHPVSCQVRSNTIHYSKYQRLSSVYENISLFFFFRFIIPYGLVSFFICTQFHECRQIGQLCKKKKRKLMLDAHVHHKLQFKWYIWHWMNEWENDLKINFFFSHSKEEKKSRNERGLSDLNTHVRV